MKVDAGKAAQCCWHVCDLKIEQDTKMSENVSKSALAASAEAAIFRQGYHARLPNGLACAGAFPRSNSVWGFLCSQCVCVRPHLFVVPIERWHTNRITRSTRLPACTLSLLLFYASRSSRLRMC